MRSLSAALLLLVGGAGAGITSPFRRANTARSLSTYTGEPATTLCEAPGCAEQVHIALGGPGEMVVCFVTPSDTAPSSVTYWGPSAAEELVAVGSGQAYSQLLFLERELFYPAMGKPGATEQQWLSLEDTSAWAADRDYPYEKLRVNKAPDSIPEDPQKYRGYRTLGAYNNPHMYYNSPVVHTVTLTNLSASTTYGYRVSNDSSRSFAFTMPPDGGAQAYPLLIGMFSDVGQTAVSNASLSLLRSIMGAAEPYAGVVLLAGDLSYADGYFSRWDSYGRLAEPLASEVPILTTGGNHEVGDSESWVSYIARYPMPYRSSGSLSNLWWSRDVGPAHVIALCSYAATGADSLQYRWLLRDLAKVDRTKTPWLIVMMHAPWYNSNSGHRGEAELMRRDMETALYTARVDLVLSGHVHAYERTHAVHLEIAVYL
jgi:hypothetical protein